MLFKACSEPKTPFEGRFFRKNNAGKNSASSEAMKISFHKAYERSGFEAAPHAGKDKTIINKHGAGSSGLGRFAIMAHHRPLRGLGSPYQHWACATMVKPSQAEKPGACATPSYALVHSG